MKIPFDIEDIEELIDNAPSDYNPDTKYRYEYLVFKNNTIYYMERKDLCEGKEHIIKEVKGITDIMGYIKQLEEDNEMFREIYYKK